MPIDEESIENALKIYIERELNRCKYVKIEIDPENDEKFQKIYQDFIDICFFNPQMEKSLNSGTSKDQIFWGQFRLYT